MENTQKLAEEKSFDLTGWGHFALIRLKMSLSSKIKFGH